MEYAEVRKHVFGASCHIVVNARTGHGEDLLQLALDEVLRLEKKFSCFKPESIISRINQDAGTGALTAVDAESRSLFEYASALWNESRHMFDPTVRILQSCYDGDGRQLATDEQLREMLKIVGWSDLKISAQDAYLSARGMLIDLNSCIRPYAVDSVLRILEKNGVDNALVELGQDIATIGKQADGANWLIGVRIPKGGRTGITRLKLNHRGFSVRGDFERATVRNDERFGRALSPVDGQPIPGLLSVAVIAENCLSACGAASVARMKTEQAGIEWLEKLGLPWMAIDRELNCRGPLAS